MMLQRRSIALVALALSLAACGSTVAPSAQR
ncbi:MAG: hypothetical protein JWO12_218, partial [Frankiales bacterium]|nr:hypothetical protein [Frankiales bacterium]